MNLKLPLYHWIIFLFFLSITFPSCQKQKKEKEYVIGFSQCVGSDLWRQTMLQEMKIGLSLHPGVKFIYLDANNNSEKQIEQVKYMMEKGIDMLIISPNEEKPLTPIVEQIYNKGIPVIIIDRKIASSAYTAYVGADNFQIGKMAGEYAAISMNRKGEVLEIMGLPGSSPAIERQKGFAEGIKPYQNIKIHTQIYGNWLINTAEKQLMAVKDVLPNIDLIFAHNDQMAYGAKIILKKMRLDKKIKIIGVDALYGQGGGLEMIDKQLINSSMLYPTGGKEALATAFKIINKEPFSKNNILQSLVIDSSNVQLMKLQWNEIISRQKDIEQQKVLLEKQQKIFNHQQVVLNITIITLGLTLIFGAIALYLLLENRKKNKLLKTNHLKIIDQRNQLIEMSEKAEKATEAKLDFFTNISHEFRTPLSLIISPLEELMKNDKINQWAGRDLKLIHKNVFRLLRLIKQLIDYRKIELGKMTINPTLNDIELFIKEIIESFQHSAKSKNIDLRIISEEKTIEIAFDVNMLDKVVFNLLSNALKFTPLNGMIHLSIEEENDYLYIKVKDNGPGISATEILHIFEHFYQAKSNATKGSGLGLSLSKALMLIHHGDLLVESTVGQSTTFTIKLPTGTAHFQHIETPNENEWSDTLYENVKIYTTELDENITETNIDVSNPAKEQSILIIEDNPDLLHYLKDKFETQYEIFMANTGQKGINSAYEQVPDLIISDVMLPDLSGRMLSERLKSDVRSSHIPIILLTAQASMEQHIHGIDSMADAYIIKPFNFAYLEAVVKNLLKNRWLLKSHYSSDISPSNKPLISKNLDKKFINDFSGIVEQNLGNENLSVDEISKEIGVSRVQLYRKVKALLDCSVTNYILNRRLKKAKHLLINNQNSISEITYMVGFSSPNYFSTVFKSKYGVTPSEFKKNQNII